MNFYAHCKWIKIYSVMRACIYSREMLYCIVILNNYVFSTERIFVIFFAKSMQM